MSGQSQQDQIITDLQRTSQMLANSANSEASAASLKISELSEEVNRLKQEVRHLRSSLQKASSKLSAKTETGGAVGDDKLGAPLRTLDDPTFVRIDMLKMLGPHSYHYGISYDPVVCFPPLNVSDCTMKLPCHLQRGVTA